MKYCVGLVICSMLVACTNMHHPAGAQEHSAQSAAVLSKASQSEEQRELVDMPAQMQEHMLANMRDHLEALNEILALMAQEQLDQAAQVAEHRLGFSSLDDHNAEHMGKFMPKVMGATGTAMHRAASQFALKAQEGESLPAYAALQDITAACVACHAGYRIR
ncbi:MAG: hypothetical protein ACPGSC_04720 [Granulosicoccaceae bacterium]